MADNVESGGRRVVVTRTEQGLVPVKTLTLVAPDVTLSGLVHAPSELHIQGRLVGDARANVLRVLEYGVVQGVIVANEVFIHGRVEGKIFARHVRLCAGSRVRGEIRHSGLEMEPGSDLDGASIRSQSPLEEPRAIDVEKALAAIGVSILSSGSVPSSSASPRPGS